MCIDLPTTRRYLNALNVLSTDPTHGAFARRTQRELVDIPVIEFIEPVATLPDNFLTHEERAWRKAAERISQSAS